MTIAAPAVPRFLARSWATHPGEDGAGAPVRSRRMLRLALASLWLLDAALQFQPYMFTKAFVTTMLAPAAQGNPAVVADPMRWVSQLMVGHPAVFNFAFATIQLAIAAGLLWRRTFKVALAASIGWAVGVWWFGEGLGGVLTGASPVTGAPGPVLLYAVAALLLWPRSTANGGSSDAEPGLLSRRGAHLTWAVLWGALACLFLLPANRAPGALHDAVAGMAAGQPGWVAAADRHIAALIGNGASASVVLGVVCYLIAISVFVPAMTRPGLLAAGALGSLIWVVQAFGGIFTGQGTDPGSGLLLVVLAASLWPRRSEAGSRSVIPPRAKKVTKLRWRTPYLGGAMSVLLGMACTAAALGPAIPPASAGGSMPARMAMGPGSITAGPAPVRAADSLAVSVSPAAPSRAARMICSREVARDIGTALGSPPGPTPTATWQDRLYSCTYHLAGGPLVIAVKELGGIPAARAYFARLHQQLGAAQPILGIASLGLPGYQAPDGRVAFLKDNDILTVDASAISGPVGPGRESPTGFAYQIATDILGCWEGG